MNNNKNVYKTYDTIARWFDEHRSRDLFEKPYLDEIISHLKPGAKILDLGCGMGEPIAQYFIERSFDLTGIDGSKKLIDLAKKRFPNNRFIIGDMRKIDLNEKFDCLIAWNSMFHLSQEDQREMFDLFSSHLKPGAMLAFTTGSKHGEEWSDNGGENLYHASLSLNEYKSLLEAYNFELIKHSSSEEIESVWIAKLKPKL